jgi:hypothetical protein
MSGRVGAAQAERDEYRRGYKRGQTKAKAHEKNPFPAF